MATEVVMPQMGESIAEGTITKWLVKVGDSVERDQPLFEISTDKVDAEIPSPESGVLLEIRAEEGDTVPVDEVVAVIGEEGESAGDGGDGDGEPEGADDEADRDDEAGEGEAEEEKEGEEDQGEGAAEADEMAAAGGGEEADEEADRDDEGAEPSTPLEERVRKYSSPLVRKMAEKEGVDLSEVPGTGIHGRVTKKDFEAFLEQGEKAAKAPKKAPAAAKAAAAGATKAPKAPGKPSEAPSFWVPPFTEGEEVEIEPMSRIREITAAHMVYSKRTSAHVTTVFHMDMTKVVKVRNRAKRAFFEAHGTKLTYMPFIFKAVAAALRKHRNVNSSVDGTNIVYKKRVNLGMAVAIDKGLLVPVIRDADRLNLVGLAQTANDLAERARSKKLGPDKLRGGTFTITNPGVFGSLFGTPVINQPQVAILGIGAIEKRPIVVTDADGVDAIAIRTMSYFGITYDHRVVDGADADHFMNDVKKILEQGEWPELAPFL